MKKKPVVCLMYDFDKTLCDRDMQEYEFIPALVLTPKEFWGKTNDLAESVHMERILSYMYVMLDEAKKKGINVTREYLNGCAKSMKLYKGVQTWFERINAFGESLGVTVEHYVLSSGIKEIIEGSPIANCFKEIYGCSFHYNEDGIADWPMNTVNYTTKTQYIHRISKGVFDITNDFDLNAHMDPKDRHADFKNMIYMGDGLTDVPCMKMVSERGGKSIALYQRGKIEKATDLLLDGRADFLTQADYSENSELETIVKTIIERISLESDLDEIYVKMAKKAIKSQKEKI
jgi:2-hydroxy-3-keto-5-methylthiopentenyl-1-phosphate phosphatase